MAVAYKAVSIAEVCYTFEVVHWVALGQLPEFTPTENGHEARLSPDQHDDHFEPIFDSSVFLNEDEISRFLPDVEPLRFMNAQIDNYGRTPEQIITESNEFFERFRDNKDPELQADLERKRASDLESADLARWLQINSKPVAQLIEQARARTFLALSDGSLKAKGYVLKNHKTEEYQYCESIDIPAEYWTWDDMDWQLSSTIIDGTEVRCAHVSTSEMLALFPLSKALGSSMSGKLVGSTFIPTEGGTKASLTTSPAVRRGRPNIGNGIVETAIRNEYRRLERTGNLSEKKEANIQMMIEWANNILGQKVARTTIQRWLESG